MFDVCVGCHKLVFFWQKKGFNSSWHEKCSKVYDKGYSTASKFAKHQSRKHGLPTPDELYGRTGSTGEMLPPELWSNQKRDWINNPIHEHMARLYPSKETHDDVMNWIKTIAESPEVPPHVEDADLELVDPYPEGD